MNYTREQLIVAMQEYNQDFLNNKEDFNEELTSDEELAATQVDYLLSKISPGGPQPKCILISTNESLGFQEMSAMVGEVSNLVKEYKATYEIQYQFKSALK